ncbi:MAG TPA: hypothetical protein VNS22_27525 [Geminicoccus sp.]|uniref:hypothetical protein n=1 Tax=Geminicoccus sp. TaxID=2024832 RepID=UPI002BE7376B|nr:hypothetical protein [Geminicoccus sp.]HWL72110.1 hypothetical protein [Geminicoccus sp.]
MTETLRLMAEHLAVEEEEARQAGHPATIPHAGARVCRNHTTLGQGGKSRKVGATGRDNRPYHWPVRDFAERLIILSATAASDWRAPSG